MSRVFRFKEFVVDQAGCAMKINTDGVLLGAIASHSLPGRILDVGTGTGVIALMLAQRFSAACVDAIELDIHAAEVADRNVFLSPFADRIKVSGTGLADYMSDNQYDLIVSNPPYFLNSLKNTDKRKSIARHTNWAFFETLLTFGVQNLSSDGSLQLVLPVPLMEELRQQAVAYWGYMVQRICYIYSFDGEKPIRAIVSLGLGNNKKYEEKHLVIYQERGVYTEDYRYLLRDFFLAF